jgi:hypothetical protein
MTELVAFKKEHLFQMDLTDFACEIRASFTPELLKYLEDNRYTTTALVDGKPLMCGGVTQYWENRAEVWVFVDKNAGLKFRSLHRAAKKYIESLPFRRVEATARYSFANAHRWLTLLGFQCDCEYLESFFPNGDDGSLYSIIRRDHG